MFLHCNQVTPHFIKQHRAAVQPTFKPNHHAATNKSIESVECGKYADCSTSFIKQHRAAEKPTAIDTNIPNHGAATNESIEVIDCGKYANCKSMSKSCYCDEFCSGYNDCCPDVANSQDGYSTSADIKIASSSCQSVFTDKHFTVWLVSRCPGGEEECLPNKTENIEDVIPVTADDNFVYVNGKCAQCHGVYQYTPWYLTVSDKNECKLSVGSLLAQTVSISLLNEIFIKDECGFGVHYPHGTSRPRKCVLNIKEVDGCPKDHKPIISKLFGPNYQNEKCCIKGKMSHCRIDEYTCYYFKEDHLLTADDLAGKISRFAMHPSALLLQFGQVRLAGCTVVVQCLKCNTFS